MLFENLQTHIEKSGIQDYTRLNIMNLKQLNRNTLTTLLMTTKLTKNIKNERLDVQPPKKIKWDRSIKIVTRLKNFSKCSNISLILYSGDYTILLLYVRNKIRRWHMYRILYTWNMHPLFVKIYRLYRRNEPNTFKLQFYLFLNVYAV